MSSIAIFPCPFTPSSTIITELSKRLDLEMYRDKNLFAEAAVRTGLDNDKLGNFMYGKTSVFNQFTLEKEKTINLFKSILAEKLETTETCLFHGFLASLIPRKATHVLKVLIVDTKQNRINYAIDQEKYSPKEARKAVKNSDLNAYYWTDFLFKQEPYSSSLYDMVIPVENLSNTELIDTISKNFHTTSVLVTPQSRQAIQDMKTEAAVEKLMLEHGHNLTLRVHRNNLTIKVEKSVLNFARLIQELNEIARGVDGVDDVIVEKGKNYNESIYRQQKFELPSKVLFVDDEKEFVKTVSQRLISRDVGTYGVFNGEDALDIVSEDRPDVMVLDLKMPGLHGVEVLRETKNLAPEVEVIILTGHGTNQDMLQCMELGAFAYLNKPVDIEELSATIKAANEKVRSRKS